jgi:thiamine kinase-like enzyme
MSAGDPQQADLDWAFEHIPQLSGLERGRVSVTPLPGFTNRNYRLHGAAEDWVLRIPRNNTNSLIDRAAEAHNQNLAYQLELAPATAWRNRKGISLTGTLKNTRNLDSRDFESKRLRQQIADAFRRLHGSGVVFQGGLTLRRTLQQHYQLLGPREQEGLAVRMDKAWRILALLEAQDLDPVPSHRDPVPGNLLFDTKRLWLIDWEYSAMASPYWDLAILCNETNLGLQGSRALLQAYCAEGPPMQESILFDYRGLLKLLNDCWMAAFSPR